MSSYLEMRVARLELDVTDLKVQVATLAAALDALAQAQRVGQLGGYNGGGGGDFNIYWAVSDGATFGSGTWPTLTPGSFFSDVYDSTFTLVASGASIAWPYLDALATPGALIPCIKLGADSYIGILESCSAVT